jgi:sialic acid synthase SpsE
MNYYLYAETAFHHEGNKEYLLKLVDETKRSGAQGVKFQVLIELDEFMSSKHSAYEDAKNWVLSHKDWKEIFEYTKKSGLDIILMPLDIKAFELAKEFDIKYIEIHSVSFKDQKLLNELEDTKIPLIFGIGGRTIDEIDTMAKKYNNREIVLMAGFQSYPSDLEDIKLERISELKKLYPQCKVGYADHSSYESEMCVTSNEYAYILGARIFEKHIALEEGVERIDYQSAVSSEKIKTIKKRLNYLESILNIGPRELFDMNEKEVTYRNRQKVPVAKRAIKVGEIISSDLVELKMINQEHIIDSLDKIIGKKVSKVIEKDSAFTVEDFS